MMQYRNAMVDKLVSERLVVMAPHMDDETLGCGGVMALHADKRQIYCIFATDGAKSPSPLLPWQANGASDLPQIRKAEARRALSEIGIPSENLRFLDFEDGRLRSSRHALVKKIAAQLNDIRPDFILVPFRFDRHADHVALHRAVRSVVIKNRMDTCVLEYFVYINWRLAPGRDIRPLVSQDRMLSVDISAVAEQKRKALDHYRSQNSINYDWQDTPILTEESLQRRCAEPECFLVSEADEGLLDCFPSNRFRLLFAHYAERVGKRPKDRLNAFLQLLKPWGRG
jgi:LmbE family N-acetylglucosaminyl deacetylase